VDGVPALDYIIRRDKVLREAGAFDFVEAEKKCGFPGKETGSFFMSFFFT
jgi:hypothetical protein